MPTFTMDILFTRLNDQNWQSKKDSLHRAPVASQKIVLYTMCRWYCRYAGWAPGQLQAEIKQGVWFTVAASKDLILHPSSFTDGGRHWHAVMQKIGGEYKQLSEALEVWPFKPCFAFKANIIFFTAFWENFWLVDLCQRGSAYQSAPFPSLPVLKERSLGGF